MSHTERLTKLGAGPVSRHKVTRKGNLKPVTDREIRKTLRERRRKKAEKLAAGLATRKLARRGKRAEVKAAKRRPSRKVRHKFPFHPYLLMRDGVAINSTLTPEQCRDATRLDKIKKLANGSWSGTEVYIICLTKKGTPVEQILPIAKSLLIPKKRK